MTINQITVHPSTVSIPVPLYRLGQQVQWNKSDNEDKSPNHFLTGVVIEMNYRIDCDASNWQYSMAVTTAKVNGISVDWYAGENCFDVDEQYLNAYIQ
jgi:hypothetical protein